MTNYTVPTPDRTPGMSGNTNPALTYNSRPKANSSSMLSPASMQAPGVLRNMRGANPVNAQPGWGRPSVPLAGGIASSAAVQQMRNVNPKLNTTPWPVSMAQLRSEPGNQRSEGQREGRRRARKIRRMRKPNAQ